MAHGTAETWLKSLAEDILDHEACFGCKYNAATALDHLGVLDEVLERLGKSDPRDELRTGPPTLDSTTYQSHLTITLDDGTVLRGHEAHEWARRRHEQSP